MRTRTYMDFKPGVPLYSIGKQKGLWKVNDIPYYFIEFLEKGYVRLQYANKPGASWNSSSKRNFVKKRQGEVFFNREDAQKVCDSWNKEMFCSNLT